MARHNDMEAEYGDEVTIDDATDDDEHLTYNSGRRTKPIDQWTQCWTPDGVAYWN